MRIEVSHITIENMSLGLFIAKGEDELGEFSMVTIGFFLFSIDVFIY